MSTNTPLCHLRSNTQACRVDMDNMATGNAFGTGTLAKAIKNDAASAATNHGYWFDSSAGSLKKWGDWPA
jgi:hypothetical protein